VFDALNHSGRVIAACDTVPFFGGHRLVIVKGAMRQVQAAGVEGAASRSRQQRM
jgi:hypothetical protein